MHFHIFVYFHVCIYIYIYIYIYFLYILIHISIHFLFLFSFFLLCLFVSLLTFLLVVDECSGYSCRIAQSLLNNSQLYYIKFIYITLCYIIILDYTILHLTFILLLIYNLFKGSNGKIQLERSRLWQNRGNKKLLGKFCFIIYF